MIEEVAGIDYYRYLMNRVVNYDQHDRAIIYAYSVRAFTDKNFRHCKGGRVSPWIVVKMVQELDEILGIDFMRSPCCNSNG